MARNEAKIEDLVDPGMWNIEVLGLAKNIQPMIIKSSGVKHYLKNRFPKLSLVSATLGCRWINPSTNEWQG